MATADRLPRMVRGNCAPTEIARTGDVSGPAGDNARLSQPSPLVLPGVPDSI